MNTKKLALIIVFTALAISLKPATDPKFPTPYAHFLIYQLWEIPIVIAFLIIGPIAGLAVCVINTSVLFADFPRRPSNRTSIQLLPQLYRCMLAFFQPYNRHKSSRFKKPKLSNYLRDASNGDYSPQLP